jgi:DNA-directed RNA polymerase subunit K/omega
MLSKPNVNDLMEKAGSRYDAALAIAKRARNIARTRIEIGDNDIKDAVDLASQQIVDDKALVKFDGKYIVDFSNKDINEEEIEENIKEILKEMAEEDDIINLDKAKKTTKSKTK